MERIRNALALLIAAFVCGLASSAAGAPVTLNRMIAHCPELQVICTTPTPVPTSSPSPSAPVPTVTAAPSPSPKPPQASCDRFFAQVSAMHYRSSGTFEVGRVYTYCVDLPAKNFPLFEIYSVNLGNASCGQLAMTAISPTGLQTKDLGSPAPGVRPVPEAGRWRVQLRLLEGCNRYDFHIAY